jgi:hypothetical protein
VAPATWRPRRCRGSRSRTSTHAARAHDGRAAASASGVSGLQHGGWRCLLGRAPRGTGSVDRRQATDIPARADRQRDGRAAVRRTTASNRVAATKTTWDERRSPRRRARARQRTRGRGLPKRQAGSAFYARATGRRSPLARRKRRRSGSADLPCGQCYKPWFCADRTTTFSFDPRLHASLRSRVASPAPRLASVGATALRGTRVGGVVLPPIARCATPPPRLLPAPRAHLVLLPLLNAGRPLVTTDPTSERSHRGSRQRRRRVPVDKKWADMSMISGTTIQRLPQPRR